MQVLGTRTEPNRTEPPVYLQGRAEGLLYLRGFKSLLSDMETSSVGHVTGLYLLAVTVNKVYDKLLFFTEFVIL